MASRIIKSMKESLGWRVFFLCLTSLLNVGVYFGYENPGPIEAQLEKDLGITQTEYSLLYSVYSYPNMILPIFGGMFLDYIGLR